jgi:hypothetical protein
VELSKDLNLDHLYCGDYDTIQLTAKLSYVMFSIWLLHSCHDPCKLIKKCKSIVGHYRSLTHAAQKFAGKLKAAKKPFKSPCPGQHNTMAVCI